jgi:hypothetical protein
LTFSVALAPELETSGLNAITDPATGVKLGEVVQVYAVPEADAGVHMGIEVDPDDPVQVSTPLATVQVVPSGLITPGVEAVAAGV